jgi:hypothetical protein
MLSWSRDHRAGSGDRFRLSVCRRSRFDALGRASTVNLGGAALRIVLALQGPILLLFLALAAFDQATYGAWLSRWLDMAETDQALDHPRLGLDALGLLIQIVVLAPLVETAIMALTLWVTRLGGASALVQAAFVCVLSGFAHGRARQSLIAVFYPGIIVFVVAWRLRAWEPRRGYWTALGAAMRMYAVANALLFSALWALQRSSDHNTPLNLRRPDGLLQWDEHALHARPHARNS